MFTVGAIVGEMKLRTSDWTREVSRVKTDTTDIKLRLSSVKADALALGAALSIGTAALASIGLASVKMAADLEEAENLYEVSLGEMADSTRAWSEEVALSIRRNASSIRDGVANFAVMFNSMGFGSKAAAEMGKEFTKLAFDMSSFYNLPHEEALDKLRAGISGEAEPLKRLGILINETTVQAYAWSHGIAQVGEDLTEQQKVVARYGAILEQTKQAQGDLARTGGSTTNQFRALQEQVKQLAQTVGGMLLPSVNEWLSRANSVASVVIEWAKNNKEAATSVAQLAAGMTVAAMATIGATTAVIGLTTAFRALRGVATLAWLAVSGPVGIIIGLLVAMAAQVYVLRAVWNEYCKWTGTSFEGLKTTAVGVFQDVYEKGAWAINAIADVWLSKIQVILGAIGSIRGAMKGVGDELLDDGIKEGKSAGEYIYEWSVPASIRAGISGITGAVKGVMGTPSKDEIKQEVSDAVSATKETVSGVGAELSKMAQDGAAITKNQIKEDFKAITDAARETFPEIASLMDSIENREKKPFEGYETPDFSKLMEGLSGVEEGGKGAAKAAKAAAKELEQLKNEAADIRLEVFPEEALNAAVRNVTELAGKFPDMVDDEAVSAKFSKLWEEFRDQGIDTAAEVDKALQGLAPKYRDSFLAAQRQVEDALSAQKYQDLLLQIAPGEQVIADAKDMIETIKEAGKLDDENESLLGSAIWERLRDVGVEALDGILSKLIEIDGASDIVDRILEARDAAAQIESASRGRDLATQLDPVANFTTRITQDLGDLNAAGALNDEMAGLLEERYWQELGDVGSDEIRKIIEAVKKISPAFAASMRASLAETTRFKKAANLQGIASDIGSIGSMVEGLGPQFAGLGRAMRVASAIMHGAAAAMRGDWLAVVMSILEAVDALGIFSDKNEEELHGMAEAMDELGDAVERWADQLADELVEFVRTGEATFKDFVDTVLDELLKIAITNLLIEPVVDWAGGVLFAKGGVIDNGQAVEGGVKAFAKGGVVDEVRYFAKGGHVTNGPEMFRMADNSVGVRGEAGPEAILPLERMADGRLGVIAQTEAKSLSSASYSTQNTIWNIAAAVGEVVPIVRSLQSAALLGQRAPAASLGYSHTPGAFASTNAALQNVTSAQRMTPIARLATGMQPSAVPVTALALAGVAALAFRAWKKRQEAGESEDVDTSAKDISVPSRTVRNGQSEQSPEGDIQINVHAYGLPSEAVQVRDRGKVDGRRVMDIIVTAVRKGMAEGVFDNDMALNFGLGRRG